MFRFHRHAIGVAVLAACAAAETIVSVRGELSERPDPDAYVYVELRPLTGGGSAAAREVVNADGSFEFRQIQAGSYELVASNARGESVARDHVSLAAHSGPLTLKLKLPPKAAPPAGSVSLRALSYRPPKSARDAFRKALKASERRRPDEALALLEKAVAIAPDYAEAVNNLAVRLYVRRDFPRSAALLRRAHELEPGSPEITSNLAAVLIPLGQPAEAESLARRALRASPGMARASYVLALALIAQGKPGAEAESLLSQASEQMPAARSALDAWRRALR